MKFYRMRRQAQWPPGPTGASWPPRLRGPSGPVIRLGLRDPPGPTSAVTTPRPLWPPSRPGAQRPSATSGPRMPLASSTPPRSPGSPLRSTGLPGSRSPAVSPRSGQGDKVSRFETNQRNPWAKASTTEPNQTTPSALASKPKSSGSTGSPAPRRQDFWETSGRSQAKAKSPLRSQRVAKQIIVAEPTTTTRRKTTLQKVILRSRWCLCR